MKAEKPRAAKGDAEKAEEIKRSDKEELLDRKASAKSKKVKRPIAEAETEGARMCRVRRRDLEFNGAPSAPPGM